MSQFCDIGPLRANRLTSAKKVASSTAILERKAVVKLAYLVPQPPLSSN